MLATDIDPIEGHVQHPRASIDFFPESAEATNCRRNVLLVPTKERPVMQFNPDLVEQMAPLILPSLNPVRKAEVVVLHPERAAGDCRFACHPVGEEDRHPWSLE